MVQTTPATLAFCTMLVGWPALAFSEHHRDWEVTCADGAACVLSSTVAGDRGDWLATLRLRMAGASSGDGAGDVLQVLVPGEVHLASGLFLSVEPLPPVEAHYQRCSAEICAAAVRLEPDLFAAMRRARAASVTYRPDIAGPPVSFAVSLMGLTAAHEAARRNLR